jgi:hypothetical protein
MTLGMDLRILIAAYIETAGFPLDFVVRALRLPNAREFEEPSALTWSGETVDPALAGIIHAHPGN